MSKKQTFLQKLKRLYASFFYSLGYLAGAFGQIRSVGKTLFASQSEDFRKTWKYGIVALPLMSLAMLQFGIIWSVASAFLVWFATSMVSGTMFDADAWNRARESLANDPDSEK